MRGNPFVQVIALAFALFVARASAAQVAAPSAAELSRRVKLGDTVFVVNHQGRELTGTLTSLTPSSLTLVNGIDEQDIPLDEIGRIERRGDPVWNGVLIGYAASAPYWVVVSAFTCSDRRPAGGAGCLAGQSLALGAGWGAIGALTDWLHKGRTVVYGPRDRLGASPVDSFSDLWSRVRTGDAVYVTDGSQRETAGIYQVASDSSIDLLVNGQLRHIPRADVTQIARRGDSLRNGAVIGASIGAVFGILGSGCSKNAYEDCGNRAARGLVVSAVTGSVYAALGMGIDGLIVGRTVVYEPGSHQGSPTVQVSPLLAPGRRGAMLSITF